MFFQVKKIFCCIFILAALTSIAVAEESEPKAHEKEDELRNHISLFGGNTQDGSENGASIGLGYEYRLNPLLALGFLGEYAGGDFNSWMIGVQALIFPHAGWFFRLAPGLEYEDSESNFLFRTGLGYEFELSSRWSLAPEFNVDFVDGDTKMVYGLSLLWAF